METVDDYLRELLLKKANNNYSPNEEKAFNYVTGIINDWKQYYNKSFFYLGRRIDINMEKSGSKAKGDALKGKSDIDIFVSITDRDNIYTIKDYYESLYDFLKPKFSSNSIRQQNVSIGITYAGCSIDITPGKRVNYSSYNEFSMFEDHYIYSRKNKKNTLTNIHQHIDLVKNSGLTKEIMLLKIWRNCHGLELPSIAIEIIVTEVLKTSKSISLYENIKKIFESLRDSIITRRIIDPANSINNIADTMTFSEKVAVRDTAKQSLSYDYGNTVDIHKIVW